MALGEETPGSPGLYIRLEGERGWYGGGEAEYGTDTNDVCYMTIYGIKGMAAYAVALGEETPGSLSLYIRLEDERGWYGVWEERGGRVQYRYQWCPLHDHIWHQRNGCLCCGTRRRDPWISKFIYQVRGWKGVVWSMGGEGRQSSVQIPMVSATWPYMASKEWLPMLWH